MSKRAQQSRTLDYFNKFTFQGESTPQGLSCRWGQTDQSTGVWGAVPLLPGLCLRFSTSGTWALMKSSPMTIRSGRPQVPHWRGHLETLARNRRRNPRGRKMERPREKAERMGALGWVRQRPRSVLRARRGCQDSVLQEQPRQKTNTERCPPEEF